MSIKKVYNLYIQIYLVVAKTLFLRVYAAKEKAFPFCLVLHGRK